MCKMVENRRDKCIRRITEIIQESHAGDKRSCAKRNRDEEIFRPFTPFAFVREKDVRGELIRQRFAFLNFLRGFLKCPNYRGGYILKFEGEDILPPSIKGVYLFSGSRGPCVLALGDETCYLVDSKRSHAIGTDELPASFKDTANYCSLRAVAV